jgi:hypothetical protein
MHAARDVCIFYFDSPTVGLRAGVKMEAPVELAGCLITPLALMRRAAASIKRAATAIMSLFNSSYLIPILSLYSEDAAAAQESYAVAAFLLLK